MHSVIGTAYYTETVI